jgi:hypothetical protein
MRADIVSVIICDDVRKEQSGKDILIGVFSGGIVLPAYPSHLRLAFWIEIQPEAVGEIHCQIKVETPSGNPPIEAEFDLGVTEVDTAVIVMGGVPLAFERDGEIVVSAKMGSAEWRVVKRKRVFRRPIAQ